HEEWHLGKLPVWSFKAKLAPQNANCLRNCKFFTWNGECSPQIIHCDIKPQNILLDNSFAARISDFGLSKILKTDQTRTTTRIRGTKGYVAPEQHTFPITAKVDVYSYGNLLLELICCRTSFEAEAVDENQMILADWSCDCYKLRKLDMLVVNNDEVLADTNRVEKCVMIVYGASKRIHH
ncbi:Serine/threonine protein kinase, partial [Parasponia andersonii]